MAGGNAKKFYLANVAVNTFGELVDGTTQVAANTGTSWKVAKTTSGNSGDMVWGTTGTANFTSQTTTPKPDVGPANSGAGSTIALRSQNQITGFFDAGNWSFNFAIRATVASSQTGRVRIRVYRGSAADGSNAVELTGSTQVGTTANPLSTSADVNSIVTWTPGTTITLNGEYLFITIAWEIVAASGSNTADVVIRTGSAATPTGTVLTTPAFTFTGAPSDTGLSVSASLVPRVIRPITDTGLTVSASIARSFPRQINDPGLGYSSDFTPALSDLFGAVAPNNQRVAQAFTPATAFVVGAFYAELAVGLGSPADQVQVQIQTDSAGSPSGTVLATSNSVTVSGATLANYRFDFPPTSLAAGTQYWFVLSRTGSLSNTNYYEFSQSGLATNPPAFSGGGKTYNGTSWGSVSALAVSVEPADSIVPGPIRPLSDVGLGMGGLEPGALLSNNAEGGTNGVTPTTTDNGSGNPWNAVTAGTGAVLNYSNVAPAHGSLGYQYATRGTSAQARLDWAYAALGVAYGRVSFSYDGITNTTKILQWRVSAAGAILGYLQLGSDTHITVRNGADNANGWVSTTSLATGHTYRIEYSIAPDGAGNSTVQVRIYDGDSPVPLEDSGTFSIAVNGGVLATSSGAVIHGIPNNVTNSPSSTNFCYLDDIVAGAPTWPGPVGDSIASTRLVSRSLADTGLSGGPGVSTFASAGYETGVNGAALTTGDAGNATPFEAFIDNSPNTITYDATPLTTGSLSAKYVFAGGTSSYWSWTTGWGTRTQFYLRGYFQLSTLSSVAVQLFWGVSGGTTAWRIDTTTAGKVTLRAGTTIQATSSTTLTANQPFRVEAFVDHTNNAITCRLFVGANVEGTTPDETFSFTGVALGAASTTTLREGAGTGGSYTLWNDAIAASTVDWIGPSGATGQGVTDSIAAAPVRVRSLTDSGLTFTLTDLGSADQLGSTGAQQQLAQSITPLDAIAVSQAVFKIAKNSSPSDQLQVQIQTDSAGAPSGTVLGTSDAQTISATGQYLFDFATPVALAASTKYWFVVQRTGALDATNNYKVFLASSVPSVYGTPPKGYNGSTWTSLGGNLLGLRVFGDSIVATQGGVRITDTGLSITDSTATLRLRPLTDTGLSESDSLAKITSKALSDTGLTVTDSTATLRLRPLTDTGLTVTDSTAKTASKTLTDTGLTVTATVTPNAIRPITDTGLSVTDSTQKTATKAVTDTGLTVSDAIASAKNRPITDVGLAVSDSVASLRLRPVTDTGLTVSDSLARNASRAVSDTGLTITTTLVSLRLRPLTDTGLTVTDSLAKVTAKTLSDTGLTVSDAVASLRNRAVSDTGLTVSDSLAKAVSKTLTDTGATITDAAASLRLRPLTDTGLVVTDSTQKTASKTITDTGASITDTAASSRTRPVTDTGVTVTDSLAKVAAKTITDTGLTLTTTLASLRLRPVTDTGLTVTDSLAKVTSKTLTDTGVTITDSAASLRLRTLTDTGATVTDSLTKAVSKTLTDTGATVTDSLVTNRVRPLTDTGLTLSDSLAKAATKAITDTGLSVADAIASAKNRPISDVGVAISDSLAKAATKLLTDTGLTVTDATASNRIRSVTDTGVTVTDSTRKAVTKTLADTGLTESDVISTGGHLAITDVGLTVTDSLAKRDSLALTDTGLGVTDQITPNTVRLLTSTGLTVTDSTATVRVRPITDTGLSVTESLQKTESKLLTDTGLTESDAVASAKNRPITDVGLALSDAIRKSATHGLTDTGVSVTDQTSVAATRTLTDTGATVTDSLAKSASKTLTDTGLSFTDALTSSKNRPITDVGLAVSDSLTKAAAKVLSDTGAVITDSLAAARLRSRSITDTGLSESDSLSKVARKTLSDTGLSLTEVISTGGAINLIDIGLALSDALAKAASKPLTDTGLTLSDSAASSRTRPVSDVGLTVTDSTRRSANRALTDTGVSTTDSLVVAAAKVKTITDTGLAVTDSLAARRVFARSTSTTGASITDVISVGGAINLLDVALTITDSLRKAQTRRLTDSGLSLSDTPTKTVTRPRAVSDTGANVSDSIGAAGTIQLADNSLSLTDSLAATFVPGAIQIHDVGLTITDSTRKATLHYLVDVGVNISDSFLGRPGFTTGITLPLGSTDGRTEPVAWTDGGLIPVAFTDSTVRPVAQSAGVDIATAKTEGTDELAGGS